MRRLRTAEPECSNCEGKDVVFKCDDRNLRDATSGKLRCNDCSHSENALIYMRMSYNLKIEQSDHTIRMREEREERKQARIDANAKYAKANRPRLPDGWAFIFDFEPKRGDELVVRINDQISHATFDGSRRIDDNRCYYSAKVSPPIEHEGETQSSLDLDERVPARRRNA